MNPELSKSVIGFADFELDLENRQLWQGDKRIELQPQAFKILSILVGRANTLVTRRELQQGVWPTEPLSDINSRLNFQMKNIRRALGDDPDSPIYIKTVPKSGYKFIASVQVSSVVQNLDRENAALPGHEALAAWRRILKPQLIVLAVLLLTASAFTILRLSGYRRPLANAAFSHDTLEAWSDDGKLLWTYSFGQPLHDEIHPAPWRIQIVEVGKSQKVLLAVPPLLIPGRPNLSSDALYAFSSEGRLLWRHDFNETIRFGGEDYGPPWVFHALLATADRRNLSIWSAVAEFLYTPSALVKLDGQGRLLSEFVNWGHIHAVDEFRSKDTSYMLAGGINNECNCAFLAVLREDNASGSSPRLGEAGPDCPMCPGGRPYRYLVFPRSEVNLSSGNTYNQVKIISHEGAGVSVVVEETTSDFPLSADWQRYRLSADFTPQSVLVSDHYWVLHQQLGAEGKIKHAADQCPERTQARTVKMWSSQEGWRDIHVPPTPSQ